MERKKIKVLYFNPLTTAGGISKIVSDYVLNLSNNVDSNIMTLKIVDDIFVKNTNIKIFEVGTSKNIFKRMCNEYKIIKSGNYDVIHINGDYCTRLVECFVAKKAGVKKIIIHSHSANTGKGSSLKKMIHVLLKKMFDYYATDFFACSDLAARWMFSKRIYKKKAYHFIKNGIDVEKYKYDSKIAKEIKDKLHINNKFIIGHIGRFQYAKNHNFLIDIFKESKEINKNTALILIGDGPLENQIKEKVKELKLEDSVHFIGNTKDAFKYYNAMNCFVLPSFFEGLPIVGVEAQANGLNTYLSDNISRDTKIIDKVKYISLDKTAKEWADIIMNQKDENRNSAYKKVYENGYDIKTVVSNLERIYQE